jgi:hypothetical protein
MAARSSGSATRSISLASSGGSRTAGGDVRTASRDGGRAGGSTGATRNLKLSTGIPRAFSCCTIASERSESSCAQVELAVRTWSTPFCNRTGRARAAMRVPTACSQSRSEMGETSTEAGTRTSRLPWSTSPRGIGLDARRFAMTHRV